MKIKKRVKKPAKQLNLEEAKAKQELAAAGGDAQSELNESVYTYYTERTDVVENMGHSMMGQSLAAEGLPMQKNSRPASAQQPISPKNDSQPQVLADLETMNSENVGIPQSASVPSMVSQDKSPNSSGNVQVLA